MERKGRRTPISFPFKEHECGYCGLHNHHTAECHYHLMNTVARAPRDMQKFERLAELEIDAFKEGKMMYEVPEAVEILASVGLKYEEQ